MYCENCGEKNKSKSKFCKTCGHLLDEKLDHKPKTEFDDLNEKEKKVVFSGSWGAFVFGPIYFISQKSYGHAILILVMSFIPIVGLVLWIYFTFNAKQISFKNRSWKSYEDFLICQRTWDTVAKVILLIGVSMGLMYMFDSDSSSMIDNGSSSFSCNEQITIQNVKLASHTVNIYDSEDRYIAYGSGFAIEDPTEGLILTNSHVIEGAHKIKVWIGFDGKELIDASVFAQYPDEDIALIKVDYDFPYKVQLSNSDEVKDADTLYAVGWANDSTGEPTITKGILSRRIKDDGFEILQTDASINLGNSGGPLINKCGVVGINTAKMFWSDYDNPAEGTGYALSSNFIKSVIYKKD